MSDKTLLRDLLFIYDRLYWDTDEGRKLAQERINEIHNGKHGSKEGCYVQFSNAINSLED